MARCRPTGKIGLRQGFFGKMYVMVEQEVFKPAATILDMDENYVELVTANPMHLPYLLDVDDYFTVNVRNQDDKELTGLIRLETDFFGHLYLQVQAIKMVKHKGLFRSDDWFEKKLIWINARIYHLALKPS